MVKGSGATSLLVAALAGAVLGFVSARVLLVGSWVNLVPWAVVGLGLGVVARGPRPAAVAGGVYGFALAYVFMLASYDGDRATATRLVPFIVFGVFGSLCGVGLAWVAATTRSRWRR